MVQYLRIISQRVMLCLKVRVNCVGKREVKQPKTENDLFTCLTIFS